MLTPARASWVRACVYFAPVALLLALWLPGAGHGWFHTDSHYYAAVGLNAVRSGEWLDLRLGDVPYHNKPPLALMVHGFFLHVLGTGVWVGRLPSLLVAMGAVSGVVKLVSVLHTRRLAVLAGVALVLTVEFTRYTRAISLDLWLACAVAWGLVALASAVRRDRPARLVWCGLAVGMGLLVKPFVALFVLPMCAGWLVVSGKRSARWWGWLGLACLVALSIGGAWLLAMALRYPGTFLDTYVVKQSLERIAWETDRPWWYYLRIAAESHVLWVVPLIGSLVLLVRGGRWSVSADLWGDGTPRRMLAACWAWALVWLVLISLTGDKHGRYAIPMYLLLCIPAAWWVSVALPRVARVVRRFALTRLAPVALALSLLVTGVVTLGGLRLADTRSPVWDDLSVKLADEYARGGKRVRCTPEANTFAANMVLVGRPWPHVVTPDRPALAGEVLILRRRELLRVEGGRAWGRGAGAKEGVGEGVMLGEVVAQGKEVVAVRLDAVWRGNDR